MVLSVLLISGAFAAASLASGGASPDRPPWADENGVVDSSKMPARIPLVGPNGNIVGYIKKADLRADPPGIGNPEPPIPVYPDETSEQATGTLPVVTEGVTAGPPAPSARKPR